MGQYQRVQSASMGAHEYRFKSTDEKPKTEGDFIVPPYSVGLEMDTGDLWYYDPDDNDWHVMN